VKPALFFLALLALCHGLANSQQTTPAPRDPYTYFELPNRPPSAAADPGSHLSTLIQQYNGAIQILEAGLRNDWPLERYFAAFNVSPILMRANPYPASSWFLVRQSLTPLQRPRTIWDERPPTNFEIKRVLGRLRSQRDLLLQVEARPTTSH
jgi:hypothetical protein